MLLVDTTKSIKNGRRPSARTITEAIGEQPRHERLTVGLTVVGTFAYVAGSLLAEYLMPWLGELDWTDRTTLDIR